VNQKAVCTIDSTGFMAGIAVFTALTLIGASVARAQLQEPGSSFGAVRMAQADSVAFDIPPQPLRSALTAFAEQSGWQLFYSAQVAEGLQSPGFAGSASPSVTLKQLLEGTGLDFKITEPRTVTLVEAPATAMPPVRPQQQSQVELPNSSPATSESIKAKPVKVPEIVVKELRHRDDDAKSYVAEEASTATRTDTPLIETPRSISVVTAKQLNDQKVRTIQEALRYTPGIFSEARGADFNQGHTVMRGFASFDSFYRDGLKGHGMNFLTYGSTGIEAYGLERIEVLRGPASALYGSIQPGGLVNTVTKRPTDQWFAEIEANAGTYSQYGGRFDLGGPLTEGKTMLFRLTGLMRDGNTQTDFLREARQYFAPAFTWRPSPKTTLTLLGRYQNDDTVGVQFVPSSSLSHPLGKISKNTLVGEPDFERYKNRQSSFGYLLNHEVNDTWKIRHAARYDAFDVDYRSVYQFGFQGDNRTLDRGVFVAREDGSLISTNTNAQGQFAIGPTTHTALFGVDYKLARLSSAQADGAGPSLDAFAPVYGRPITIPANYQDRRQAIDQIGLYAQDQVKLFDQWVLSFGLRHDWAQTETNDHLTNTTTSQRNSAFTGQAGLVYLFKNGLAPYFSYGTSFDPQAGADRSGNQFVPTTGKQYEGGIKYAPPGTRSVFTVAAFQITQQKVLTPDPVNALFSVQTGEIQSRGVEVEAKTNFFEDLNLIATYTYTDAKVTASNDINLDKRPVQVPDHMASLWGYYAVNNGPLSGFGIGSGIRYVGRSFGDSTNTFKVPDFTLVDGVLHYDIAARSLRGTRLAVNIHNLFDREYLASCSGQAFCFFGQGRVVTGSITYRW
jgi:iron complex outermembrane recepter protein